MAKTDTKALLRARFAELRDERDAIEKKNAPLREQLRELRQQNATAEAALRDKIKATSADLVSIDQELASISRGLMGKTGAASEG